jgi:hypothetical protein
MVVYYYFDQHYMGEHGRMISITLLYESLTQWIHAVKLISSYKADATSISLGSGLGETIKPIYSDQT